MKILTLTALFVMSLFADDYVVLDRSFIKLDSNRVTLEKVADTPDEVSLIVPVVHTINMCNPADERTRRYQCNETEEYYDPYCYNGPVVINRGVRYNPPVNGTVVVGSRRRTGTVIVNTTPSGCWRTRVVQKMCTEVICVNPYTIDEVRNQNFKLKFHKFDRNTRLEFIIDQYGNLSFSPLDMESSCLSVTKYGSGSNVTGAKLKIKRRCK